jgi:hypothetical protein
MAGPFGNNIWQPDLEADLNIIRSVKYSSGAWYKYEVLNLVTEQVKRCGGGDNTLLMYEILIINKNHNVLVT